MLRNKFLIFYYFDNDENFLGPLWDRERNPWLAKMEQSQLLIPLENPFSWFLKISSQSECLIIMTTLTTLLDTYMYIEMKTIFRYQSTIKPAIYTFWKKPSMNFENIITEGTVCTKSSICVRDQKLFDMLSLPYVNLKAIRMPVAWAFSKARLKMK